MARDLLLRLSLLARMCVAFALLVTGAFGVAVVVGLTGGYIGLHVAVVLLIGFEYVASAPRVSTRTPVPAVAVVALALATAYVFLHAWPRVTGLDEAAPFGPVHWVLQAIGLSFMAAFGYLAVVEASAALATLLAWGFESVRGLVVLFSISALLTVAAMFHGGRLEVRRLVDRLLDDSRPAVETAPEAAERVRRLAHLADVPTPETRVTYTDRPESFAVGSGEAAVVVVSTGLIEALSPPELEAVLAHEVSHLANADSRLVTAALVPVLVADDLIDDNPSDTMESLSNAVFVALKRYGQFGVAVLSRGREWSADLGAVELTGSPAALASALATLHGRRRTPETDLREWEASIAALDILPAVDDHVGPFLTHPPTVVRIARLRRIAAAAERQ